jgi:hypothetical protein
VEPEEPVELSVPVEGSLEPPPELGAVVVGAGLVLVVLVEGAVVVVGAVSVAE